MHDRTALAGRLGAPLPTAVRVHLDQLTDRTGILQHAIGWAGDPQHGYCADDVARALELDLMQSRALGWTAVAHRARSNLRFLRDGYRPADRWFSNFRRVGGEWLPDPGSEDCQGRVALALGSVLAWCPEPRLVELARALLIDFVASVDRLGAPRAIASTVLGLELAMDGGLPGIRETHARLAGRLMAAFAPVTDPEWLWPESTLTYENALLPRALISAGGRLGLPEMTATGLRSLDWLIDRQTAPEGHLSLVGNGWWPRGGPRSRFDQQPIDATALLRACATALDATGQHKYRHTMELTYAWFLGANDAGVALADPARGAGCDGLSPHGVNSNHGAESTLMWLIAVEQMRLLRSSLVMRADDGQARQAFLA